MTDLVAVDFEDPATGAPGFVFARHYVDIDWAHFSYIVCDTIEDAEVAYYNFMDFEFIVEASQ